MAVAAETEQIEASVIGLWLEIDLGSGPITGTIRVAGDAPKPYFGWAGLTAVIEGLRTQRPVTRSQTRASRDGGRALTRTERDIVELVCEGMTNPQIAELLSVSPRTVQGHLLKTFRKLKVSTRAELVGRMLRAGAQETSESEADR